MHRAAERIVVPRGRPRITAQREPLRADDGEHVAEARIVVGVEARVIVPVQTIGATPFDPAVVVRRARKEHRDPAIGVDARDRHVAVLRRAVGRTERLAAANDAAAREPEIDLRLAIVATRRSRNTLRRDGARLHAPRGARSECERGEHDTATGNGLHDGPHCCPLNGGRPLQGHGTCPPRRNPKCLSSKHLCT